MALRYAGKARDRLALPDHSDLALANALYLANGEIVLQTAAKERMRWLSVQLALTQLKLAEALSRAEKGERGTPDGFWLISDEDLKGLTTHAATASSAAADDNKRREREAWAAFDAIINRVRTPGVKS